MSCIVYIGLGSNQENPARQVLSAMDEINQLAHVTVLTRSSLYQTKPWGMVDQPDFINAVIQCKTSLSPRALLEQLLLIEKSHGRVRKEKNGPRTLDCDILLYDNEALNEPGLEIPHPMITTRAFVLFPLAQIAPDLQIPHKGPISDYLTHCNENDVKKLLPLGEEDIMNETAWQNLETLAQAISSKRIADLFTADPARVNKFSISVDEIYLDYSKNFIDDTIKASLVKLAHDVGMPQKIKALIQGEQVNNTEGRPALHTALRQDPSVALHLHDQNIIDEIKSEKEKMYRLVNELHQGVYLGASAKKITDVVNLGIGGSDLGPMMAVEALKDYQQTPIKLHFVSNIDPDAISSVLKACSPATTLFILSSKSFTTPETLANAQVAQQWLKAGLKTEHIAKHFIGVTANPEKAKAFGILPENILQFWDWVGGRYSIWSSIGLPLAISIGAENFDEFLLGARKMDEHFASAPLDQNMPVILGLLGAWYIHCWQATTLAVLPYSQRLKHFSDYLQQLDMESNGKSVSKANKQVTYATGPIVWGQAGTNGQHAFYQLLHQGTHFIPVDFIVAKTSNSDLGEQHKHLVANCLAQAAALMQGSDTASEFAHEHMPGNKPSNLLLIEKLSPRTLGLLLALYEHKVYVQGVIWDLNSFDQPGVELGKKLAKKVVECLMTGVADQSMDLSTKSLIEKLTSV